MQVDTTNMSFTTSKIQHSILNPYRLLRGLYIEDNIASGATVLDHYSGHVFGVMNDMAV